MAIIIFNIVGAAPKITLNIELLYNLRESIHILFAYTR